MEMRMRGGWEIGLDSWEGSGIVPQDPPEGCAFFYKHEADQSRRAIFFRARSVSIRAFPTGHLVTSNNNIAPLAPLGERGWG
jgi:hypothetical protein